jgi:histidinol-phosphate/aromatic aminotransferase/cobyric acid decarboxylase-like protein
MLDFGAQGGDPSRGVNMDLSTCVNRYGPAPAAIAALHSIEPADILLHPYEAAPAGLLAVAVAHPAATLVVDESYIDFTPDPSHWHAFSASRRTGACPVSTCALRVQRCAMSTGPTTAVRR